MMAGVAPPLTCGAWTVPMDRFLSIEAFVRVAETRSFAEAARQLGVTNSVVTHRVQQLERFIEAPLFHRSTRRLSLTEDGQAFLARATRILREVALVTSERRGTWVHYALDRARVASVPGLEAIATIDETKKEFSIPGRALAAPKFPTADGRATLFVHDLPPAPDGLLLMTIRSEGQFNTVVYEEEDLYRNQSRRDIVLIHPDDVARFGLVDGGRCTVKSAAGTMRGVVVSAYPEIRPGAVAMYYPESNVLVPKTADPLSRTPAYKSVAVTIEPEARPAGPRHSAAAGGKSPAKA